MIVTGCLLFGRTVRGLSRFFLIVAVGSFYEKRGRERLLLFYIHLKLLESVKNPFQYQICFPVLGGWFGLGMVCVEFDLGFNHVVAQTIEYVKKRMRTRAVAPRFYQDLDLILST